jgi:hypothetical protein
MKKESKIEIRKKEERKKEKKNRENTITSKEKKIEKDQIS